MTIEEIFDEWEKDSDMPEYEIVKSSQDTARLHHKYHKMLTFERLKMHKLEGDIALLKKIKQEYYLGTLDTETMKERGYKPFKIRVLKSDVQTYMDSDQELIQSKLKLSVINEKIEFLQSVIKMIMNRSFTINNTINYIKFREGIS